MYQGVDAVVPGIKGFNFGLKAVKGEGIKLSTNADILGFKGGINMQTNFKNTLSLAASFTTSGEVDTILQPNT